VTHKPIFERSIAVELFDHSQLLELFILKHEVDLDKRLENREEKLDRESDYCINTLHDVRA
jgi:hypothetical protein